MMALSRNNMTFTITMNPQKIVTFLPFLLLTLILVLEIGQSVKSVAPEPTINIEVTDVSGRTEEKKMPLGEVLTAMQTQSNNNTISLFRHVCLIEKTAGTETEECKKLLSQ